MLESTRADNKFDEAIILFAKALDLFSAAYNERYDRHIQESPGINIIHRDAARAILAISQESAGLITIPQDAVKSLLSSYLKTWDELTPEDYGLTSWEIEHMQD